VNDVNGPEVSRPYRSTVRAEGARRTRRAIVLAAGQLFENRGYRDTSLSAVAEAAGVARPTVTAAFGSKPALLREVVDQALAGDDEPVPVAERPWFRPVLEAQTHHHLLAAYAQVCTLIDARTARVFEVVRRAADASSEVADLWERIQRNRRAGGGIVVTRLRGLGPVRGWPGDQQAVDIVFLFNDPAHYDTLVMQCGWPEPDFTAWLTVQMQQALIDG
jgi:AcrR family transcriptional regulator